MPVFFTFALYLQDLQQRKFCHNKSVISGYLMRLFTAFLLSCAFTTTVPAQATIVRAYPNDTFNLSCASCKINVVDVALTKGQQSIPINLNKPVSKNLFHWRYYDEISKENVTTADEPVWAVHAQLLDDLGDNEVFSLHLNLTMQDSTDRLCKLYLVLAGITKNELKNLPLETNFDPDTYLPLRFAVIAQITPAEGGARETYDCMEGTCTLDEFNPQKIKLRGTFDFKANKVGVDKRGIFLNGTFER